MGNQIYFKIAGIAEHVCSFNLPSVSYSFWNKGRKVLKFWKFDEKREITPKWVMGFTSK